MDVFQRFAETTKRVQTANQSIFFKQKTFFEKKVYWQYFFLISALRSPVCLFFFFQQHQNLLSKNQKCLSKTQKPEHFVKTSSLRYNSELNIVGCDSSTCESLSDCLTECNNRFNCDGFRFTETGPYRCWFFQEVKTFHFFFFSAYMLFEKKTQPSVLCFTPFFFCCVLKKHTHHKNVVKNVFRIYSHFQTIQVNLKIFPSKFAKIVSTTFASKVQPNLKMHFFRLFRLFLIRSKQNQKILAKFGKFFKALLILAGV